MTEQIAAASDRPRITIITPTFNSYDTLSQTLGSLAAQRDHLDRYIVADGGSTDGTLGAVEEQRAWFGDRLQISSQRDQGVYDAMNRGLALALKGADGCDLIGIINSDDYYLPGTLEAVTAAAIANPDIDMFYGDAQELSVFGVPTGHTRTSSNPLTRRSLLKEMSVQHPSVFLRARTYERIGNFNLDYRIAADYDLMFRVVDSGVKTLHLGRTMVAHREGGLSHRARKESLREAVDVRIIHGVSPLTAWVRHLATQGWYRTYKVVRPICAPLIDLVKRSNTAEPSTPSSTMPDSNKSDSGEDRVG